MIGVLALALGFFASVYVYRNLQSGSGAGAEPGVDVIVAADDLQVGARVEEHDIKIIKIPGADLPPTAPRKRADVMGHGVIIPISKGEFILPNRLAGENAGSGLPSLIPPGMRAVSVRVNEVVSVAGFVTPGTRVDVLLTGTPGGAANSRPRPFCRTSRCWPQATRWSEAPPAKPRTRPSSRCWFHPTMPSVSRWPVLKDTFNWRCAIRSTPSRTKWPPPTPEVSTAEAAPAAHHDGCSSRAVTKKVTPPPPPASTGVSIEVYQGDKKPEVVKFPDESPEAK